MANIQFGGLITGLDTNALVSGLVQAERRSITVLQGQKTRFQAQDAVFGSVVGALGRLKSSAQNLSLSTDFLKRSASSSDSATITAAANSNAAVGSSLITVDSLAKAQSVQSTSFAQANAAVGTGTLTISVGSATTAIVINGTNNSLEKLRDAINNSGAAVNANIVNVSAGAIDDYRLVVQNSQTGTINAVTISGTLTGGVDPFANGGQVVQMGTDAVFSVNGLKIIRSSNTISDVIPGVTFTLLDEGDQNGVIDSTDPTAKISVVSDNASITKAVTELVESFNTVNKTVNEQFSLDPNTNRQGSTAGDAALRGMISRLRKEMSAVGGTGAGFSYLSDIGIKFEKDGSLTLDEGKLSSSLQNDPTALANLFVSTENGVGKRLPEAVDDFISAVDGSLVFRQKGIGQSIKQIDDKIAREEKRIAALEEQLVKKFTALEELVSQLKAQGEFLTQQLSALQTSKRR
jgi:flagellar hook-associated protein 2